MIPRAMAKQGKHLDELAAAAEAAGHRETALMLYTRAISVYFMAQNCIYRDDDQEKIYLHSRVINAFDGCMRTARYVIERVEIPFEDGTTIQANFHRAPGADPAPAVLFVPGMDMTKEGYPNCASNDFVNRGMHVLSIDGPGQGISNIRKLRLTLDNYERAGHAAISWLAEQPDVDADRIGIFGVSMGSHWSTQIAATDSRVKAVASGMACYTNKRLIFDVDAPRFKRIFMYMTDIHDEEKFDEFSQAYVLDPYFDKLRCPTLMIHGEFDPLSDLDEALALYARIDAPKEFWILEDDFHDSRAIDNLGGTNPSVIAGQ
jgi:dipeptidyl aminopeptidase/acylaminoacyl peptidase